MSIWRVLAWLLAATVALFSIVVWRDLAVWAPSDLRLVRAHLVLTDLAAPDQPHRYMPLLEVDLESTSDIQTLSNRYGLFVNEVTKTCGQGTRLSDFMYPGVYDGIGLVDIFSHAPNGGAYRKQPSGPRNKNGKIVYKVFLNVEEAGDKRMGIQPYDLKQKPTDLCLYIEGAGNFWLGGEIPTFTYFRSNTIVVPRQLVASETAEARSR